MIRPAEISRDLWIRKTRDLSRDYNTEFSGSDHSRVSGFARQVVDVCARHCDHRLHDRWPRFVGNHAQVVDLAFAETFHLTPFTTRQAATDFFDSVGMVSHSLLII